MSTEAKTTNVEKVLPNDEDLGRRNCRWRELVQKYEEATQNKSEHSMDIDTAMVILDQDMSDESSVSDVIEASSEEPSPAENVEEIQRQLKEAIPRRKRQWEANGLKEILDDNEFRMLSHEKVENWLRNHMYSITSHFNVHYQTKQVTTVTETETRMDADADSLYSVDTAQYIRSNKQISNKLKVTTMIKQYSVTSSVRRLTSLGIIVDEQNNDQEQARLSLPLPRALTKSDSTCDVKKALPQYTRAPIQKLTVAANKRLATRKNSPPYTANSTTPMADRSKRRRKVFKKTIPRKRPGAFDDRSTAAGHGPTAAKQRYDPEQMYTQALEQCARQKKTIPASQRKMATRLTNRKRVVHFSSSSSESECDEVFFAPIETRNQVPCCSTRATKQRPKTIDKSTITPPEATPEPPTVSTTQHKRLTRVANRMQIVSSSSSSINDSDEQRFGPMEARDQAPSSSRATKLRPKTIDKNTIMPPEAPPRQPPIVVTSTEPIVSCSITQQTSPTEREIVGSMESITLSAAKRQRSVQPAQPAGPFSAASSSTETIKKKKPLLYKDGFYFQEGVVIYRPTTIRPDLSSDARIRLRVGDLNLSEVTKPAYLEKFQTFNYLIHPNSTLCFYPSDTSDSSDAEPANVSDTSTENSYEEDPIATFRPRNSIRLHVVQFPYNPARSAQKNKEKC